MLKRQLQKIILIFILSSCYTYDTDLMPMMRMKWLQFYDG